jgi:ABC-2 type transport system permease protein
MRKLGSAVLKEMLLLVRDLPGLAILFIMPVVLIMIVTIAQQNAMKSAESNRTSVLVIREISGEFPDAIVSSLKESGFFTVITELEGKPVDEPTARTLISKGDYQAGISFPRGDTSIILILDPTLQESHKKALVASLTFVIKGAQSRNAIQELLGSLSAGNSRLLESMINGELKKLPPIRETYAFKDPSAIKPGIMQNDVPAFILFAIFFIVLPLSGNIITEKTEGSFRRLRTTPVPAGVLLSAKVIVYLIVGFLQFLLMLFIGAWVLPMFFGLPGVEIGNQYFAILLTSLLSTLAAIGLGLLTGSLFSTHGQAASFGSVFVVILGVISGTFLPVYLMPGFIQKVSLGSPIRWGIECFLDLFYRQGNLVTILPWLLLLLFFFFLAMIASIVIFVRKN